MTSYRGYKQELATFLDFRGWTKSLSHRGGFADLPDFLDGSIGHGKDELVFSGSDLDGVLVGDV